MRTFADACLEVGPSGTTVLVGPNGSGKTTLLEAVAYLGSERSFRTAARESMVRLGADSAILRGDLTREERPLLVEGELSARGGARTFVNRQRVTRRAQLAAAVPSTVFSPEDLGTVQGAPARRRLLLDDALRVFDARAAASLESFERALRQRAALLRQASGRLTQEVASTLDVWDERLASSGELVAHARAELVRELGVLVEDLYGHLAAGEAGQASLQPGKERVSMRYRHSWEGPLLDALGAARADDVRRGVTTVGPHHDELELAIGTRSARTHASQGEQRSLALALRLGIHLLTTARRGAAPVLLLDDVFSELDPVRSRALIRHLPAGQALLTTAGALPPGVDAAAVVEVTAIGRRG